jgi:hypothetical protein
MQCSRKGYVREQTIVSNSRIIDGMNFRIAINEYLLKEMSMSKKLGLLVLVASVGVPFATANAGRDTDAASLFRNSSQSAEYFTDSYAYAVFPTIGKGGLGVGAAHGSGHVYSNGHQIGKVSMNQLSVGLQAGGEAFSEMRQMPAWARPVLMPAPV